MIRPDRQPSIVGAELEGRDRAGEHYRLHRRVVDLEEPSRVTRTAGGKPAAVVAEGDPFHRAGVHEYE